MPIPDPGIHFSTLHELHSRMKTTHKSNAQFDVFKHHVRTYGKRYLDVMKTMDQQIKQKRDRFMKKVLLVEPALARYEKHWPINLYFDSYTKNFRYNGPQIRSRVAQSQPEPEIITIDSSRETSPVEIHPFESKQVDKAVYFLDLTIDQGSSPAKTIPAYYHTHLQVPASEAEKIFSSQGWNAIEGQQSPTPVPSHWSSPEPTRNTEPHWKGIQDSDVVTAACCLCGVPTEIDCFLNTGLSCFVNDASLLEVLASLGVFFDQHLDILLSFDDATRMAFFDRFPPHRMTALAKFRILKSLKQQSINHSRNPSVDGDLYIQRPGYDTEQAMLRENDTDFTNELQKSMRLEDDLDIFNGLLDTMGDYSRDFFSIVDPKIDHLRGTIRRISKERLPDFRKYTNYWPIRLYLEHHRLKIDFTFPQYTVEEEQEAFTAVFEEQNGPRSDFGESSIVSGMAPTHSHLASRCALKEFKSKRIEQVPCKIHPPIDITGISMRMRTYLQSYGIGELLPAFVHVGIRTDGDFDAFLQMRAQERTELIVNLGKVKLTELQMFLLHIAFGSKSGKV